MTHLIIHINYDHLHPSCNENERVHDFLVESMTHYII